MLPWSMFCTSCTGTSLHCKHPALLLKVFLDIRDLKKTLEAWLILHHARNKNEKDGDYTK